MVEYVAGKIYGYKSPIKVMCRKCDHSVNEEDVEFVDIEEDIQGKDLLKFICPKCGRENISYRVG